MAEYSLFLSGKISQVLRVLVGSPNKRLVFGCQGISQLFFVLRNISQGIFYVGCQQVASRWCQGGIWGQISNYGCLTAGDIAFIFQDII